MSLSFEATPQKVKAIIKDALEKDTGGWKRCEEYAKANGFQNIDYLLEEMIYRGEFGALVVIDELHDELETVLVNRFKFGVEVLTLNRYRNENGGRLYDFEPFLSEVTLDPGTDGKTVDNSDIDMVVVPALEEGFNEVFLGENRWRAVRLHSSMIPKIKYIATYQTAPVSAITYVAPVESIEPWHDSGKYVLNFSEPATELPKPLKPIPKGKVKHLQNLRYTSYERLMNAKTMEEAF